MLRRLAPGLHVLEQPQRFLGLEVGARMTVLELDGGLLVHSPVAVDPGVVASLGEVRWVLAPNLFHHLHLGPWLETGAAGLAPPGLAKKREDLVFSELLTERGSPCGEEVLVIPLQSFPFTEEVVLLHRPSKTLVVTDLVFNLSAEMPWLTRTAFWALGGYPGCRTTVLEQALMERELARGELESILGLRFDRLVMAHGEVVESGGRDALARAFEWLLPRRGPVMPYQR